MAEIVEDYVDLGDRPGAANPGAKVMTLVHGMLLGADCIDDCDVLRCGQTSAVLGHAVLAPSTLGTFLGSFTPRPLGDQMVAAALIARLVHHAHIVTLKGKSYRLRQRGTGTAPAAAIQPAGLWPTT